MTKAEFCQALSWRMAGIKWLDLTGMKKLARNRVAKIQLTTEGAGRYYGLVVSIINRDTGVVDRKEFQFIDYLDFSKRSDNRTDYTNQLGFYAMSEGATLRWYIAVPQDTRTLCEAVETYLKFFEKAL